MADMMSTDFFVFSKNEKGGNPRQGPPPFYENLKICLQVGINLICHRFQPLIGAVHTWGFCGLITPARRLPYRISHTSKNDYFNSFLMQESAIS